MSILFSCQFYQKFAIKTVSASYYLKLSLPMFLKCFLTLSDFSLVFLIDMFLIRKPYILHSYI